MTASINPIQYVELGMMVCNHLEHKTGVQHTLGNFLHVIQNCHIYDRHMEAASELLKREPILEQPSVSLNCGPKNFYHHTVEDFTLNVPAEIQRLGMKLELAK